MKEFIEFIAKSLVDDPESVVVEETIDEEKKVNLTLRVKQTDVGKVIGKKGKTSSFHRMNHHRSPGAQNLGSPA